MNKIKSLSRLMILTLALLFVQFSALNAQSLDISVSGFYIENRPVNPGELNNFIFLNNLEFSIQSNIGLNLSVPFHPEMSSKQTKVIVNASSDLTLQFSFQPNIRNFISRDITPPARANVTLLNSYSNTFRILSNDTVGGMTFQIEKSASLRLNPSKNYSFAVYSENNDSWNLINTVEDNGSLQGTLQDLNANEVYYLTLYELQPISPINWILVIIIVIIGIVGAAIVISRKEFFHLLKTRISSVERGAHEMSLEDVLENKNRNLILDLILAEPGIHFNELLRRTNIAPGNLVWHLNVLETYRIIGKKRIENRLVYYPLYDKNPFSNLDIKIRKNKLTLDILKTIEDEPGIWTNETERRLEINRKTIQYHINKLVELWVIKVQRNGRQNHIFINFDSDYYKEGKSDTELKE